MPERWCDTFRPWLILLYVQRRARWRRFLPWLFLKGSSSDEIGEVLGVLLSAQDRECVECSSEIVTGENEGGIA